MTLEVSPTTIITIDDTPRPVEDLSAAAKQLITFYDDWKQRELDARSALLVVQMGLQGMNAQIGAQIKKDDDALAAPDDPVVEGNSVDEGETPAGDGNNTVSEGVPNTVN